MISVTTDSIPPRDRAEFWADLLTRPVRPMRIEPGGEGALRGEIEARPVSDLRIARVSGVGINALHTRAQVARGDGRLYGACVSLEGEARITRRAETIALQPGDIFITDSRQEFALDLVRPWRHLLITVPTGWLDSRVARPERLAGAVLRANPLGACGQVIWPRDSRSPASFLPARPRCSRGIRSICWCNCSMSRTATAARLRKPCAPRCSSPPVA